MLLTATIVLGVAVVASELPPFLQKPFDLCKLDFEEDDGMDIHDISLTHIDTENYRQVWSEFDIDFEDDEMKYDPLPGGQDTCALWLTATLLNNDTDNWNSTAIVFYDGLKGPGCALVPVPENELLKIRTSNLFYYKISSTSCYLKALLDPDDFYGCEHEMSIQHRNSAPLPINMAVGLPEFDITAVTSDNYESIYDSLGPEGDKESYDPSKSGKEACVAWYRAYLTQTLNISDERAIMYYKSDWGEAGCAIVENIHQHHLDVNTHGFHVWAMQMRCVASNILLEKLNSV